MIKHKIYGPPGTGKTTFLIKTIERLLSTHAPEDIAFVSFTRKGAHEGADRARERFGFSRSRMPYFKTIHSLCFSELGLSKYRVMQAKHYKEFSRMTGFNFVGHYSEEFNSIDDKYLFAVQMIHNNPEFAKSVVLTLDAKKLWFIARSYKSFKSKFELFDYTDMLMRYLEVGTPLPTKVVVVDEAQDLTPLQWAVVHKMASNAEELYVAGDDDQAIYTWSGASPRTLIDYDARTTVLSQSYRVPGVIHGIAARTANLISQRAEKVYSARDEVGELNTCVRWEDVVTEEGTLILARNRCFLEQAITQLRFQGVVYRYKDEISTDHKVFNAIEAYEQRRRTPSNEAYEKRAKLYKDYFVVPLADKPWYDNMTLPDSEVNYYRALIANRRSKDSTPSVELNTIHASKGAEADHVVLALDTTERVHNNFTRNPDDEWRCFYVGLTRAKRRLTLKLSSGQYGVNLPIIGESNV